MNEQVTEGDVIVEVQIDNSDRLLMVDSDEVIIKKSIDKDARVTVKVNEKQMPLQEYYQMIEAAGFMRHDPLNFMLQSKIRRVGSAREDQLYGMLCTAIGTQQYEERRQEGIDIMQTVELDEKKSMELLEDFREKLNDLEVDKEDYEKFEQNLKEGNQ